MNIRNVALGAAISIGVGALFALGPHAGAKGAKNVVAEPGHVLSASTRLALVGGEDPNASTNLTPGFAIAGVAAPNLVIRLDEMDATRFPATARTATGTVTPCIANLAFGSVSGTAPVTLDNNGRTFVQLVAPGTAAPGAAASVDVVCNWADKKLGPQHHETHWAGVL